LGRRFGAQGSRGAGVGAPAVPIGGSTGWPKLNHAPALHVRVPGVYPGSCRSSDFNFDAGLPDSSAFPTRASRPLSRNFPDLPLNRRFHTFWKVFTLFPQKIASERRISRCHPHRFCALRAPCSSESDRLVHHLRVRARARLAGGATCPPIPWKQFMICFGGVAE
jgi:hypothetical protein